MGKNVWVASSGRLTTYLGTAPGVGKTYTMLAEARRRRAAGDRVIVGWIDTHGRPATVTALADLEVQTPHSVTYRGREFPEVDVGALLAANPDLVVVDELPHTWPGVSRARWEDVAEIVAHGIDALTALNVANLESTRDYAARITGAGAVEAVPDEFVRSGEVILVDLPADVLRRRLASGAVFSAEQVGGALGQYFRLSNLEALSELGRGWVEGDAKTVGDALLARRGLTPLEERPVVLAGVSGSAWGEAVILRAARLACDYDADLVVLHATLFDRPTLAHPELLAYYRQLTEGLGASFVEVAGESAAQVIADQASGQPVSAVVVARHRSSISEALRGSVTRQLRRRLPGVTVDVVTDRTPGAVATQA